MSTKFINQNYYVFSVLMIFLAFAVFFFSYEKKKPQAREIVTLAVMSAIAVASRAAFAVIPFFKPMLGIIMITGMAFGSGAGFLVGTVTGFVSNFIFGQGPWTPWQMFAYGIGGALAGILAKYKFMHENKKILTAILGYGMIQLIVGPILDVCSIFTMGGTVNSEWVLSVLISGIAPNAIHGAATFFTLLILCKPMMEKLNRIKLKYGIMDGKQNEI